MVESEIETTQAGARTSWLVLPQTQGALAVAMIIDAIKFTIPLFVAVDAALAVIMTWFCIDFLIKEIRK